MARRATAIQGYRSKDNDVLVLDAGDALFGQPASDNSQGKALVEAMGLMKYDAVAVGERDLGHFAALLERSRAAAFPFLSANLVYSDTGKPVFAPYVVRDVGGRKVAVIGLTAADDAVKQFIPQDMAARDPIETAREVVAQVRREGVDAVIILAHQGSAANRELASEVEGISLIVGGHTFEVLSDPILVNDTAIVQAGYNGEWLGMISLDFDAQGRMTVRENQVLSLTEDYGDAPELAALVARYPE